MQSRIPSRAFTLVASGLLIACSERTPTMTVAEEHPQLRVDPSQVQSAIGQIQSTALGMQRIRELGRLSRSEDALWGERIDSMSALAFRLGRPGPTPGIRAMDEPYESPAEGVIDEANSSTSISLGGTDNKIFSHTALTAPAGEVGQHVVGTTTTNGASYPIDADRGSGILPVFWTWDSQVSLSEINCNAHSAGVTAQTDHTATWFIHGFSPKSGSARTISNRPINSPECPYVGPTNVHFAVSGAGQSGTDGLDVTSSGAVTFNFTANVAVGDAAISSYQWTATNNSGTTTFGSAATASYSTSQGNTGIHLRVIDGNGKSSFVDGAVNVALVNETSEPSPCGTQIIYDPSTCESGGEGGGGTGGDPSCTYYLITPVISYDDGLTWSRDYSRSEYIVQVC